MPKFAQLVIGPAGCGKSTYCATIQAHCETIGRSVEVDDVMEDDELRLGPNGGLIFCMEHVQRNLEWLDEAVSDIGDYALFDCPGQIELYSHLSVMQSIIRHLESKWDFRFVTIFVLDAKFLVDTSNLVTGVLAALSSMNLLITPHISILSKMDLLSERKQRHVVQRFLNPQADLFGDYFGDEPDDCLLHPQVGRYSKLTSALVGIVERYSLVAFLPFNREKESSIADLLHQIDVTLQYDEHAETYNRFIDEAERDMMGLEDDKARDAG